jgi:hypothetical protein
MFRIACAFLLAGLLAGCNATFHAQKPDATTGLFATQSVLKADDVRVAEKFDSSYTKMLYLKVNAEEPNPKFVDFFASAFKEMHTFQKVMTKDELQQVVIERNLGGKVPSVSDLVGLNNLSKEIGPFLIVEPNAVFKGGYMFEGTLKVTDASTGKLVLFIDKTAFNMAGLDDPLFNPMLNGFINWTHNQPIAQKQPASAK